MAAASLLAFPYPRSVYPHIGGLNMGTPARDVVVEMMGVEPTGRRVEVSGVEMNYVQGGRITASWTVSDAMGLMRQLGAL